MDTAGTPRVSVIVRTKDRPRLLAEALASLREQTFRDFEVLVVNDGGGKPEIADVGAPLRVVDTEPPHGRTRALNTGLHAARGRFVAYLDDDDLYLPQHLERLERFLSGSDTYRAAFTHVRVVRQKLGADGRYGGDQALLTHGRPFDAGRLLSDNTIPLIGVMHDRELALSIGGFDETFDLYEDWDFLIRLAERTRFHAIPEVTAVYRLRDDGTNATIEAPWRGVRSEEARRKVFEKHWRRHSPATQAALVDAIASERDVAVKREHALRVAAEGERDRFAAEAAQALRERDQARAEASREREEARAGAAREREEAALVRADAARQIQAAGERETALASRASELQGTLDAYRRSRVFRIASPWWRLKAFLSR